MRNSRLQQVYHHFYTTEEVDIAAGVVAILMQLDLEKGIPVGNFPRWSEYDEEHYFVTFDRPKLPAITDELIVLKRVSERFEVVLADFGKYRLTERVLGKALLSHAAFENRLDVVVTRSPEQAGYILWQPVGQIEPPQVEMDLPTNILYMRLLDLLGPAEFMAQCLRASIPFEVRLEWWGNIVNQVEGRKSADN